MAKFTEHVILYQRTSYSETTASLWLSLRLQVYVMIEKTTIWFSVDMFLEVYRLLKNGMWNFGVHSLSNLCSSKEFVMQTLYFEA